jgi:hypothetical protein
MPTPKKMADPMMAPMIVLVNFDMTSSCLMGERYRFRGRANVRIRTRRNLLGMPPTKAKASPRH